MHNHEIGFYYQIAFANHPELYDKSKPLSAIENTGLYADNPLTFALRWFPLAALDGIPLYPTFLKTGLFSLPASVQHIVHTAPMAKPTSRTQRNQLYITPSEALLNARKYTRIFLNLIMRRVRGAIYR